MDNIKLGPPRKGWGNLSKGLKVFYIVGTAILFLVSGISILVSLVLSYQGNGPALIIVATPIFIVAALLATIIVFITGVRRFFIGVIAPALLISVTLVCFIISFPLCKGECDGNYNPDEASNCIHALSRIEIVGGSETAKNIHVGDLVAFGVNSKFTPVYYVVHHLGEVFEDGISIQSETTELQLTPSHVLSINGEMRKAKEAKLGDSVITKRGKEVIKAINKTSIPERVLLMTLEGTFVANDILISSYEGEHKSMHLFATPVRLMYQFLPSKMYQFFMPIIDIYFGAIHVILDPTHVHVVANSV